MANSTILTADREADLRKPIDEYIGKIQAQIDALRVDGTDKVVNIQNELDNLKRDRIYTAEEKASRESGLYAENRHTGSIAGYKNRMPRRDKLAFVREKSIACALKPINGRGVCVNATGD